MSDKRIDIEAYDLVSQPPKQVLFDFFGDQPTTEAFQIFLYQRGWKVTKIDEKK